MIYVYGNSICPDITMEIEELHVLDFDRERRQMFDEMLVDHHTIYYVAIVEKAQKASSYANTIIICIKGQV